MMVIPFPRRCRWWLAGLALLAGAAPAVSHAQTRRCEPVERVRTVAFDGSPRFNDVTMATSIVTQQPSALSRWLRLERGQCADTLEIRRDALRIAVMHRSAGWFQARVMPLLDRTSHGIAVRFVIEPGPEAILDTVVIDGLPEAPEGRRAYDAPLRDLQGKIFDRARVDTTVESVLLRLRNVGFARAGRPTSNITIDTAAARVRLELAFNPGDRLTLGEVHVQVAGVGDDPPRADSAAVMRLIALRPGQRFRADAVLEAQRDLYRTEAFRLVLVDTLPADSATADSLIDLRIAVAEAQTRSARAGVGWATQDCMRVQGRVADRSFLGIGRRVEVAVRASKIGIGAPLDFAPALCSNALRQDPFSEDVNYYVGTSVSNTRLFGYQIAPTLSVYSERRGEPFAYLRETTIGALAEVSRAVGRRSSVTGGFQYENGRTQSDPVQACSRFAQCTPEDIRQSLFGRGVSILSIAGSHDRTNDVVNPWRGGRMRAELRAGETSSLLARSLRFYRATAEASGFLPFLSGVVATRVQVARAFAPGFEQVNGLLIPPQERLFGGGQNSVRGYQQNLLGPLVYRIADENAIQFREVEGVTIAETREGADFDRAVPRGGTGLTVLNVEFRQAVQWFPLPLQLVGFVDAGNVWEAQAEALRFGDLRATPGLGIRLGTPIGPFRVDIGYRPYEANAGRAYFFTSGENGSGGRIICVSPGNRISVDARNPGNVADCPATYRPPSGRGVLSRLAFHFGLGQAF